MSAVTPSADTVRAKLRARTPRKLSRGPDLAAVAAVLRLGGELEVLLIKRAVSPDDPWSGHMAFPGGRRQPGDADPVATAVRETREEVGIDLGRAELLGRLDDVQAVSRARPLDLVIVPYVFLVAGDVALAPDPREVQTALWAPVAPMMRGENASSRHYQWDNKLLVLPAWTVQGELVWGLTYRMLEGLCDALR